MQNNIGLVLENRSRLHPKMEGLVDLHSGLRLTYSEMNRRADQAANLFTELGVKKGDRVAILLMNSPEFVESFFGLAKIGAVIVALNWRLVPNELEYILKDSEATVLLFGSEFADAAAELNKRTGKTEIQEWLQVGVDGEIQDFAKNYARLHSSASSAPPTIGAAEDDLLYLMYTSGTTGLPKGVVHSHNSALWALITIASTVDGRVKDRYLISLPLYHVGALTPLTNCVYSASTILLMRSFDPLKTWETIRDEKVSTMLAVPAMLNFMLQVPNLEQYDHSALRWCMSGASPVPVTLVKAYEKMGIEIQEVYGLTECCGPACVISSDDAIRKVGSTGKAFFHTEVRIVDEQGNEQPPGEPGEIMVKGKHLMLEYWNQPEATAQTLQNGWLRTGDVAVMDEEGFVYIKDRVKDMIISGGENIYPAEIENVILSHPDVTDVAVIGRPDQKWGEVPLAVVVRNNESLTDEEVLAYCHGKLAKYKLPQGAVFTDEIPRNPTGKPLKRILREQFLS